MPNAEMQTFRYESIETAKTKAVVTLCKSDIVKASVQYVKEGGENNLHSHSGNDGVWVVLRGGARFYGEGDALVAELGPNEGILVPRETPYWFESSADEPLEILHVAAFARDVEDRRTDHRPRQRITT